jgi:lipopolysaccharide/colanic/teichoic acid biosynthesis glycosyltransferase
MIGKVAIEALTPNDLIVGGSRGYHGLKRIFSVVAASVGLLLCAPFMALIAIVIKLDSPGPVFFFQERIGLRGRRFRLIKFRSMIPRDTTTSEWAGDNADRITRVGAWLRKYHLDELPQFFNILAGNMELVGPRPTPLSHHDLFEREIPNFALRSVIRPGLTGWAQVRIGYANNLAAEVEKMRYDIYYVMHQSFAFDLQIIRETVAVVLFGRDTTGLETGRRPPSGVG